MRNTLFSLIFPSPLPDILLYIGDTPKTNRLRAMQYSGMTSTPTIYWGTATNTMRRTRSVSLVSRRYRCAQSWPCAWLELTAEDATEHIKHNILLCTVIMQEKPTHPHDRRNQNCAAIFGAVSPNEPTHIRETSHSHEGAHTKRDTLHCRVSLCGFLEARTTPHDHEHGLELPAAGAIAERHLTLFCDDHAQEHNILSTVYTTVHILRDPLTEALTVDLCDLTRRQEAEEI